MFALGQRIQCIRMHRTGLCPAHTVKSVLQHRPKQCALNIMGAMMLMTRFSTMQD